MKTQTEEKQLIEWFRSLTNAQRFAVYHFIVRNDSSLLIFLFPNAAKHFQNGPHILPPPSGE